MSSSPDKDDCITFPGILHPERSVFMWYCVRITAPGRGKTTRNRLRWPQAVPVLSPTYTHVALLAEAGVPLETISRRLGHSDGHTTRDVYFHVTKRMEEHDRRLLDTVQILQTSWVLLTFC